MTAVVSGGQYRPLTQEQVERIHEAALQILERTGFTYESGLDEAMDSLERAGASVDRDQRRVRFPRQLVTESVARAPSRVILYSRDGRNDLDLGEDRVFLGTGGAAIKILDLETGELRASTLRDLYQLGRLVDRLEHIHFFLRPCIPTDIPEAAYDVNVFYTCLKATTKHVMAGVNDEEGLRRVVELASIVAGGREALVEKPFISVITSFAISPLKFCTQSTRIMLEAVRNRIPVALSSAPMAGSTSPMTMAGTLAQLHAEELAGITLCQVVSPGAPLLYGGIPGMADLRTMGYLGGAVECGMMNAAIHQLARHVGVPNYNSSGLSDSKVPDAQAGWEKAMTTLLAAMGGSNYIHHAAGMLESMLTVAAEQYVIDDEIIGMSRRVLQGIPVDDEHLALETIDAVGPGGNYMMAPHTIAHMRKDYFMGNGVTDRSGRAKWEENGRQDARERARAIARKLLATEDDGRLPEEVDRAIRQRFEILL
ncbi:MAG: trimethylamine methyltransferase [Deltaproteobacteria bacterium]|nr:trimethylamine methyltransferase [Deltaproteobacteria bacterium]